MVPTNINVTAPFVLLVCYILQVNAGSFSWAAGGRIVHPYIKDDGIQIAREHLTVHYYHIGRTEIKGATFKIAGCVSDQYGFMSYMPNNTRVIIYPLGHSVEVNRYKYIRNINLKTLNVDCDIVENPRSNYYETQTC